MDSLKNYLTGDETFSWSNKNTISIDSVAKSSLTKCWWQCHYCDNEWLTSARNIYKGSGCPICSRIHKDITKTEKWEELKKEWDYSNGNPKRFGVSDNSIISWNCQNGHQWKTSILNRFKNNGGCSICSARKITNDNNIMITHKEIMLEWNYDKNTVDPVFINYKNTGKFWWTCKLGHDWKQSVYTRIRSNSQCPYCANRKLYKGYNDLISKSPELLNEWDYSKNTVSPDNIIFNSSKKVSWKCSEGHEWETTLSHRTTSKSQCPKCQIISRKNINSKNNFAANNKELLTYWDYSKNTVKPTEIKTSYNDKIWWKCKQGHSFDRSIKSFKKYKTCPYCTNQKILLNYNDLLTTNPDLASELDTNKNVLQPTEMTIGSGKRVWWLCDKGHSWQTTVSQRSYYNSSCGECAKIEKSSKSEKELQDFIKKLIPNTQIVFNTKSIISPKELDIYIPSKNIAIEYNGLYWHSEEMGKDKNYHYNKWNACKDKGIQLITIWEDDWLNNSSTIKKMIEHKLGLSKTKVYARQTIFEPISNDIAKKFLNDNHIQGFKNFTKNYALKYNNDTVAVISFSFTKNKAILHRYATSCNVTGGFTKILKNCLKTFDKNIKTIETFSDNCVSNGALYKNNGWKIHSYIAPDYFYYKKGSMFREHKFLYRINSFRKRKDLLYEDNMTERELARLNGLFKIWDTGKIKWVYDI